MGRRGLDWSGSEYGRVTVACECDNETSGSIKYGEFLYELKAC